MDPGRFVLPSSCTFVALVISYTHFLGMKRSCLPRLYSDSDCFVYTFVSFGGVFFSISRVDDLFYCSTFEIRISTFGPVKKIK